jgi:MFS family permease
MLLLLAVLDLAAVGMAIAVLPRVATELGFSKVEYGYMMTMYGLSQFLMAPIAGNLGDLFGRRTMLIVCSIGAVFGYLLSGFAVAAWMLVASRLVVGALKFTMSFIEAYIVELTTEAERPVAFGRVKMAVDIGLVIGPLVGGVVMNVTQSNLAVILMSSAVFMINVIILLVWTPPAPVSQRKSTSMMSAQSVTDADVFIVTEYKKITFDQCIESMRPSDVPADHVHTIGCYFKRAYCEFVTGIKALVRTVREPRFGSLLLGRTFVVLASDVCSLSRYWLLSVNLTSDL